jgi:hypothetical protein
MENDTEKNIQDSYRKSYMMQSVGTDNNTIRTSVPRQIIEREARRLNISISEFISNYKIVWIFDGFSGALTRFEQKDIK